MTPRPTLTKLLYATALVALVGCAKAPKPAVVPYIATDAVDLIQPIVSHKEPYPTTGSIERLDPTMDNLIAPGTKLEVLAEGFVWAEGPVWVEEIPARRGTATHAIGSFGTNPNKTAPTRAAIGHLLFSDIPPNAIYKWTPELGAKVWMRPSGYTGDAPRSGEPGSNGLALNPQGKLVMCQHGDRRIARLESMSDPQAPKTAVVDSINGKRFNSPNDLCFNSKGDMYFTDPPYGLQKRMADPAKELDYQGVYLLRANGDLVLLTKEVTRPNGIALSPTEKKLYVASSDPNKAIWMVYDVKPDGTLENGKVFFDATDWIGKTGKQGLPDGLKVDRNGNVWATGPGGVLIFNKDGKHIGSILTGQKTANVAWGGNGSDLYITADMKLCRIRTRTRGAGW